MGVRLPEDDDPVDNASSSVDLPIKEGHTKGFRLAVVSSYFGAGFFAFRGEIWMYFFRNDRP